MKIKSIRVLSSAAAAVMALAVISGSLPTGFIGNNNDSYGITANAAIFESGYCGANENNDPVTSNNGSYNYNRYVRWEITENGGKIGQTNKPAYTLVIKGSGAIADFESNTFCPWYQYAENITDVVILDGVTSIGKNAFSNSEHENGHFDNLRIVCIGKDVRKIDKSAFEDCTKLSYIWFEDENTLISNNTWNVYKGNDEDSPFHGAGTDSEVVENGKHIIYVYTKDNGSQQPSITDMFDFGKEYNDKVDIKTSNKTDFPLDAFSAIPWNKSFITILANAPEGTLAYRRIRLPGTDKDKLAIIKLTADDLNSMIFRQVKDSHCDDIFVSLPENYYINGHAVNSETVDVTKWNNTSKNYDGYEIKDGEIVSCDLDINELKNFRASNLLQFGENSFELWAVRYNSPYEKVDAKPATCIEDGNIGYWHDSKTDKYYADAKGETELTKEQVTIPANGVHNFEDGKCSVCGVLARHAQSYEIYKEDDIIYNVYSKYAEVADCDDDIETADIKDHVCDVPVTTIQENAFNSKNNLKKVNIPETVETIKRSAFWGAGAIEEIYVPKTVKTIEKGAFVRCANLKNIIIRNPECTIDPSTSTVSDAYNNKTSKYNYSGSIYGFEGSTAQEYAELNGYDFKVLSPEVTNIQVDEDGNVTWNKAENAVSYRIVKVYNNKAYYGKMTDKTSYKMLSNTPIGYDLYVRSYTADGQYTESEPLTVSTKGLEKPGMPSIDDKGVVSWEPTKGAVAYRVFKIKNGKTYCTSKITDCTTKVNYNSKTTYAFFVRAYDGKGNYTDGAIIVKPGAVLDKITEAEVNANGEVFWESVPNAVSYKVGKVIDGKTYYGERVTGTSYVLKNVPKKPYQIFVVAFNAAGATTYGSKIDITPVSADAVQPSDTETV